MDPCDKAILPEIWTLVFHTRARRRWVSLLAAGRFKHVSAFAWIPDTKQWLVFEWKLAGFEVVLMPDGETARAVLREIVRGNATMRMRVLPDENYCAIIPRFYCTGAIAHLLRLPRGALRPDSLWRLCLQHGGEIIQDGRSGQ